MLAACSLSESPLQATQTDGDADADTDADADADADVDAGRDAAGPDSGPFDAGPDSDEDARAPDGGPPEPQPSCAAILASAPGSPSGPYTIRPEGGKEVEVYCDMESFEGGWTRIAAVDASTGECPGEWVFVDPPGVCTRPFVKVGSWGSAVFPSPQGQYGEVMGWVSGLQREQMDGFVPSTYPGVDLAGFYVDGVSIITEEDPPQHVWTYAVGWSDDDLSNGGACPCVGGTAPPDFVGTDYYCESGATGAPGGRGWFVDDPLWDGNGIAADCDAPEDPSVFVQELTQIVDVPIEVRLVADQISADEDVGVTQMELFVR